MKDGAVVHNPEFGLIWFSGFNGEDIQPCFNLVQWFQRRRVKCEKKQTTDDGSRSPSDDKYIGKLKRY